MKIKIKQSEINKCLENDSYIEQDEIDIMIDVIEGIVHDIKQCGWCEGYRNDMTVDFTICCYYLGLDGKEIFKEMYESDDYPMVIWVDTQDFNERYDTVMYYCKREWTTPYRMDIDMPHWVCEADDIDDEDKVCVIVDDSKEAVTE